MSEQLIMYVYMSFEKKVDSERSYQTLNMYRFSELSMMITFPIYNCYCAIINAFEKGTGSKLILLEARIKM